MPHRQSLKGTVTLHVLVQKHLFPGDGNATELAPVDLSAEFKTQVATKTETKYTAISKALQKPAAGQPSPWTCTMNGTLCKAVVVMVVQTLGSRVFVPDGPTTLTLFATFAAALNPWLLGCRCAPSSAQM